MPELLLPYLTEKVEQGIFEHLGESFHRITTATTKALTLAAESAERPLSDKSIVASEERLRLGLLIMGLSVLMVIAANSILFRRYKSMWASISVIGSVFGVLLSLLGIASHEVLWDQIQFLNENVFFSVMVPPIVFSSGFVLMGSRGEFFFKKLGTILWYAIFGTFLSSLLNFFVFYLPGVLFISTRLSVKEALTLSTILSATDLSAVQPLFRTLTISPLIETITMGETIFNDGVAYTLYRMVVYGKGGGLSLVLTSSINFVISMVAGVVMAVVIPVCIRKLVPLSAPRHAVRRTAPRSAGRSADSPTDLSESDEGEEEHLCELIIIQSMPWLSYLLGESLGLQGIIVCMCAGIGTGRYTLNLYDPCSGVDNVLKNFFASLTILSEACSFIFLGASLSMGRTILKPYFDAKEEISKADLVWWIKPVISSVSAAQLLSLHLAGIVGVTLVRLISVYFTSWCVNELVRKRCAHENPVYIKPREQLFIALCGARGAMAVALALRAQTDLHAGYKGSAIVSAALTYTLFTVFTTALCLPKLISSLLSDQVERGGREHEAQQILNSTRPSPDAWDYFLRGLRHMDHLVLVRIRRLANSKTFPNSGEIALV